MIKANNIRSIAMSGTSDRFTGKAKKAMGDMTGNDRLKTEGKMQESKGILKEKIEKIGHKMSDKTDSTDI
jgi:uncharacterized protein YjbJ (UPF0337 family)